MDVTYASLATLDPAVDHLLDAFKYQANADAQAVLCAATATLLREFRPVIDNGRPTIVTWVPSYLGEGAIRDFDHLERLVLDPWHVGPLLRELGWEAAALLRKAVPTERMARRRSLTANQQMIARRELIRSLEVIPPQFSIADWNLVILDDVVGTHVTLNACIEQLIHFRPRTISALALFKRGLPHAAATTPA